MPVLAFPGPVAPAPPAVTLEVPEGWEPVPAGAGLLRARGTGSAGDLVEVGVAAHTAAGVDASVLVDGLTSASAPAGSELEDVFVVEIGGREWAARNVSWDEPGGPVVEVALVSLVDETPAEGATGATGAAADRFVVATGRVRGVGLEADYDTLQSVLETIVVGERP
ncbi:hypothetical protein [Oryzobacter terrae]|uniref:hypothetical protein n=1 Tax=Oryzobacter terrae TaxID=1620385 RepID=UPI0036730B65